MKWIQPSYIRLNVLKIALKMDSTSLNGFDLLKWFHLVLVSIRPPEVESLKRRISSLYLDFLWIWPPDSTSWGRIQPFDLHLHQCCQIRQALVAQITCKQKLIFASKLVGPRVYIHDKIFPCTGCPLFCMHRSTFVFLVFGLQ